LKRLLLSLAALLALGALAAGTLVVRALPQRSRVRALARRPPGVTALMRQREREARALGRTPRRERLEVPLSRVSKSLVAAVITAEDARFYEHHGVDWQAVRDSARHDWRVRRLAFGGSTLTQQLAKNLFFGTRRTPFRKLEELIVAGWLERDLGKPRILELYLNVVEWGDGVYGCEAAARRYYGVSAADLSLEQAAGLAAMLPNPRRINPLVNPARFRRAQARVLRLLTLSGRAREELREVEPAEDEEPAVPDAPEPSVPPTAAPSLEPPPGSPVPAPTGPSG
jgi:monofunctional glycosyltransferase